MSAAKVAPAHNGTPRRGIERATLCFAPMTTSAGSAAWVGWWSGANLFWLAGDKVMPLLAFWHGVEQDRKKGMKIVGAFGPMLLLGALFRMLTIHQAVGRAGRRFGLTARVVPMPQAEACIDVDKEEDRELADAILARRN